MPAPAWRLAAAQDVPALAALYAHCARTMGPLVYTPPQVAAWASFGADTPAFRDYVLGADTWWLPAPEADAMAPADAPALLPLGFCGVAAQGDVHSLYVRPDQGRRGLGAALLAHAISHARTRGVRSFSAWATPFSRPVFERAGFTLLRVSREPYQGVLFDRFRLQRVDTD
jgi:putative acetyltransferase